MAKPKSVDNPEDTKAEKKNRVHLYYIGSHPFAASTLALSSFIDKQTNLRNDKHVEETQNVSNHAAVNLTLNLQLITWGRSKRLPRIGE